jgi:hypothetical protein
MKAIAEKINHFMKKLILSVFALLIVAVIFQWSGTTQTATFGQAPVNQTSAVDAPVKIPAEIEERLSIVVERISLMNVPVDNAAFFLEAESKYLDAKKRKVSFRVEGEIETEIDVNLRNITVRDALDVFCKLTDAHWTVVGNEIVIRPGHGPNSALTEKAEKAEVEKMENHLKALIVPKITFDSTSIHYALHYLRAALQRLNPKVPELHFVITNEPEGFISFSKENISAYDCVQAFAKQCNCTLKIEGKFIWIAGPKKAEASPD